MKMLHSMYISHNTERVAFCIARYLQSGRCVYCIVHSSLLHIIVKGLFANWARSVMLPLLGIVCAIVS